MQEQPPSDPPRREPAVQTRRSRSTKPTFTPPPAPEPEPARAEVAGDKPPRPRRVKAAPTVLFQPPDPAQATPPGADVPAAPRPRPSAEVTAADADPGTPAGAPPPATAAAVEPVIEEPVFEEAPKRPRRAPAAKKAAPARKATSAARKSTTPPEAPAAPEITTPAAPAAPEINPPEITAPEITAPAENEAPRRAAPRSTEAVASTPTGRARKSTRAPAKKAAPMKRAPARPASGAQIPPEPIAAQTPAEPAAAEVATRSAAQPSAPGQVIPVVPAQVIPPAEARDAGTGWRAVGARVLDHPGFAPELLALAAVDALGPRAADWVQRTRDAYPDADADGLARLVTRRFVRLAGTGGALAAGAGLFAPVAELTAVLWTQANLVLHLAAVYGRDPAHPDRVAELLVLTQVHPDAGTARAALDAARSAGAPAEGPWSRAAEAAWRLATPLAAQATGWLGLRLAARLLPGAAALAAAAGDTASAQRLAARAINLYRPTRR
ncbi:hypothetical protein [Micromonospora fulviviridis]|uniref:EcsC family protein n=1 Tax=Micromonospora fulviviridis TaxID=47860 RepID=A0ABV2VL47_9ACTN